MRDYVRDEMHKENKGPSIKYVRKNLGFLTPTLPLYMFVLFGETPLSAYVLPIYQTPPLLHSWIFITMHLTLTQRSWGLN